MTTTTPQFPADWYDSPNRPNTRQYWDGHEWTDDYAPISATVVPNEREKAGAIVSLGYILAVLMPLIGFILGIVVVTRPEKVTNRHGAMIILVSVVAFVIYLALLMHGTAQTINVPSQ